LKKQRSAAPGLTRREFGIAAAALALSGCAEKTPPAPVDLAVYGHCRQYAKIHRQIAASIATRNPKAVVVAGDLVNRPEDQKQWDLFKKITGIYSGKVPMLPLVGNHDVHPTDGNKAFLRETGLAKSWYDRQIGDFHFFVLDSINSFQDDREQLDWLQKTAEASTAKHKFAAFHHPPFIIDPKRLQEAPMVLKNLHPLLVKMKFCAGLCGHQHAFYYTRRDGIPYVVTGGGGSALGDLEPSLGIKGDLSRSFYHFVGLKVVGPKIEGHVYEPDGDEVAELAFPVCDHASG